MRLLRILFRVILILAITLIGLEIVLQVAFGILPQSLTQRLPQYPVRYGIRFDLDHGARLYPAHEQVDFEVNQFSGDLFSISCLQPINAQPLEPYTVSYQRDQFGFRNAEPYPTDANLVVVGDSFVAGELVQQPFWQDLSERTIALGLPGSGTLEQGILLEEYGLNLTPKNVLLAYFGGNDLMDNWRFQQIQNANTNFYDAANQNRQPWEYLVSFQTLMLMRETASRTGSDCHYPLLAQDNQPLAFYDRFLEWNTVPSSELVQSNLYQLTEQAIVDMGEKVRDTGTEFTLLYIPFKLQVYWDTLPQEAQQTITAQITPQRIEVNGFEASEDSLSIELISEMIHAQRNAILNLANTQGWNVLDLTPVLQGAVNAGEKPYFFADTHWNQAGHDIVHEAVRSFLFNESTS